MFSRKFGLDTLMLGTLVDCESSHTAGHAHFRAPRFYKFVTDALDFFDSTPELLAIRVVATAEVTTEEEEGASPVVRIFHKICIETEGITLPFLSGDQGDSFVSEYLPGEFMERGSFELRRDDPYVQMFLGLEEGLNYRESFLSLVFLLGYKMAIAFTTTRISHHMQ